MIYIQSCIIVATYNTSSSSCSKHCKFVCAPGIGLHNNGHVTNHHAECFFVLNCKLNHANGGGSSLSVVAHTSPLAIMKCKTVTDCTDGRTDGRTRCAGWLEMHYKHVSVPHSVRLRCGHSAWSVDSN